MTELIIRPGHKRDIAPLDALLARSYPALLARDYAPSVLVTAVPLIARAQPALVTCGTYFVAVDDEALVGAGGWTLTPPGQRGGGARNVGHIRHFVTDATRVRRGIGRALMQHVLSTAIAAGVRRLHCQSTHTAVAFYQSAGFVAGGRIDVPLAPGITFPAVSMVLHLEDVNPDGQARL